MSSIFQILGFGALEFSIRKIFDEVRPIRAAENYELRGACKALMRCRPVVLSFKIKSRKNT